jgi:integrase
MTILTDRVARNVLPGGKPVPDGAVSGLRLLPSITKGHGKWQLRFVSPETGKRRDMGLGVYPEVQIGLARKAAVEARELISQRVDPIEERKRLQQSQAMQRGGEVMTFKRASLEVHKALLPGWKNAKHRDQWINTLTKYAFPIIGDRAVAELEPADFAEVLRPIWLNKVETASRVRQRCHAVMKWCWGRKLVANNPLDIVDTLLAKQDSARVRVKHHPAMSWQDVPAFVHDILHGGSTVPRSLLEFIILTAARSGEARAMTWAELDLEAKIWTVPAARMKAQIVHRVPLSDRAVEILADQGKKAAHANLVFPSPRGKVLSDMALTKLLRDHKVKSSEPGRTATAHGFRSSFRDWCSELGYPRDYADRALAHTIRNQAEAAYHRTDLLEQRRPMMDAWGQYISQKMTITVM